MVPGVSETQFTEDEILAVFPNRGNPVTTEMMWRQLGSPKGKKGLLQAAMKELPPSYATKEEAQAAGADPGARSSVLLAKAAIAVFANSKGMKPGSKLGKLQSDFSGRLPEFFRLCGVTPPSM